MAVGTEVAWRYSRISRLGLPGSSTSIVTVTVVVLYYVSLFLINPTTRDKFLRGLGDDGSSHEAGAVGLARLNGLQSTTGTGNLASAVIGVASTGTGSLHKASHGNGNERQDNGGLHLE